MAVGRAWKVPGEGRVARLDMGILLWHGQQEMPSGFAALSLAAVWPNFTRQPELQQVPLQV